MNPTRARKMIRDLARAGRWELSAHARGRMIERGYQHADVESVLTRAESCRAGDPGCWRLDGEALAGDRLAVVVAIKGLAFVVTLFGGDDE